MTILSISQRWRLRKLSRPLDGFAFLAGSEKPISHVYLKRRFLSVNEGSSFAWWLPSLVIDLRRGRFFYLAIPTALGGRRYHRFVRISGDV